MGGLTGNTIVLTMAKVPANGYEHIIGVADNQPGPIQMKTVIQVPTLRVTTRAVTLSAA